jgi:hypothetical protein
MMSPPVASPEPTPEDSAPNNPFEIDSEKETRRPASGGDDADPSNPFM